MRLPKEGAYAEHKGLGWFVEVCEQHSTLPYVWCIATEPGMGSYRWTVFVRDLHPLTTLARRLIKIAE